MADSTMMDGTATDAAAPPAAVGARATGRLLLPVIKLKSSASSKQLEQKLNYLWGAAHALVAASPALAHATAATILETARQQRAQLPQAVLDYLCQQCGALLVPSVSAAVRVVPQRGTASANRKLARQQQKQRRDQGSSAAGGTKCERLRNVVALACQRCGFANLRHGASVVYKPKQKLPKRAKTPKKTAKATAKEQEPAKRPLKDQADAEPASKKAKTTSDGTPVAVPPAATPTVPAPPRSMFAKPASPPRRLLDAKKKKKKPAQATAQAAAQVKSSLDSFLSTLKK